MDEINYLIKALTLAQNGKGRCSPNPAVGAIVVKNDKIIGQGYHEKSGSPHAERVALTNCQADDAILYTTLEPCSHWGKTPPCTNFIIDKKIKKVYFASNDSNQHVSGQGAEVLRRAGIDCIKVDIPVIADFYKSYHYWQWNQLPYITLKIAMSQDNKIALKDRTPVKLTSDELNQFTHQQRLYSDGILTTVTTIIADDPQLNARFNEDIVAKPIYILDSHARLPLSARIFKTGKKIHLFHRQDASSEKINLLKQLNVNCYPISHDESGLKLQPIFTLIGQHGVHDLWVEAGATLAHQLISKQWLNKLYLYQSPHIIGENGLPVFEKINIYANAKSSAWHDAGVDSYCEVIY